MTGTNINKNRTIYLSRAKGKSSNDDTVESDWRRNVSSICGQGGMIVYSDNFDVDSEVELLMTDKPIAFKTHNDEFIYPVKEAMDWLNKVSKGTIVGGITKTSWVGSQLADSLNGSSSVWQPWAKNIPSWNGSKSGIQFEYEFKFVMGQYGLWNALEEVVKPIINLAVPAFPRSINNSSMDGPFPNVIDMVAGVFSEKESENGNSANNKGNNDDNWVSKAFETIAAEITKLINNNYPAYEYTIRFGNFIEFNNLLITKAQSHFSNEVDQYGHPVSGSITLEFTGAKPMALNGSNSGRFGDIL